MAKETIVKWSEMKKAVDAKVGLSIQYIELDDEYKLSLFDGPYVLLMSLSKNPSDPTDLIDFETNYKPNGNGRVREESFTVDRRLRVESTESSKSIDFTRELILTMKEIKKEIQLTNKHLACLSDQQINIDEDLEKE